LTIVRSSTYALLWELWHRHRLTAASIAGLTVGGRLLDFSERAGGSPEPSTLVTLMCWSSFAALFGLFDYTESADGSGFGRFPPRLFTLPVSSLQLVTIPVVAGVGSVELLYLLWLEPLTREGQLSPWFVAILLAAMMVFYQAVLWTLERLGAARLLIIGAVGVLVIGVGLLPSFAPSPPPPWRSETALAAAIAGLAALAFLISWRYIASVRGGGGRSSHRFERLFAETAGRLPRRRKAFASPAAAQLWFEWRCAGIVLPVLVAGVLLAVVGPLSWVDRADAGASLRLLLGTLAMPVILAIPVGMAFSRPAFWSEDLSVPAFVAVRPLTDDDLIAVRVKVAAASAAASWMLVLSFVGVWLSLWANVDALSQLAVQWWAFHAHSRASVFTMGGLIVVAGLILTWRFLVSRLWTGMSGRRPLFVASVMSVLLVGIAAMVFNADRLPDWLLADPSNMRAVVWTLAITAAAKYWLAARSWRHVAAPYVRRYLTVWAVATACLVALAVLVWGVARIYVAVDIYRLQALMILVALLAVPVGRVGLAPAFLARNRHR
jgi:hypothetical protein